MILLMVNRRPGPDKKVSSVNETPNDGAVTFALDGQESDIYKPQHVLRHPPLWCCKNAEPDSGRCAGSFGEEAAWRADFGLGLGFANSASGDGDEGVGSDWSSGKKLVAGTKRHRHSVPRDAPQLDTICLGPTLTTSLSHSEPRNLAPNTPAKLMADDSTGKFAYISLDGRLINAELATSVTTIGGKLEDEEARAWEDFAPMERVLIVAVAAAAAAAAKHMNVKEIDRLLKTVENREKELSSLSQELHEICQLNVTGSSNASHLSRDYPQPFSSIPKTPDQQTLRAQRRRSLKVNLGLRDRRSSTKRLAHPVVVISRSDLFTDEVRAKEEAKWYVNPMVEPLQGSDEFSTLEQRCPVLSPWNPPVLSSLNWPASNSSGTKEMDVSTGIPALTDSPFPRSTETRASTLRVVANDGPVHEESKPMRALCAAVVLDLRERILAVVDKELSMIMAAVDTSVKDAKTRSSSMRFEIARCWNDLLPEALAALNLSPAEFDCFLPESRGTSPWNHSSKTDANTVAWRQYLENKYGGEAVRRGVEGESPGKLKLGDGHDVSELVKEFQSKEVEISGSKECQKALLESEKKEVEEPKGDLKSRDVELDEPLAAANADRIAKLEELCRAKDSTISDLKQDIQFLESKVQNVRVTQSAAVPQGRRYSTSAILSSNGGNGTSQRQRSSNKYIPSDLGTDLGILKGTGRLRKEVLSNKEHLRNLPHFNTRRHEDLADDGRSEHGCDRETYLEYPSTPTIGDDYSGNAHVFSESEVESRFGSEYSSSGDDARFLGSKCRHSRTLALQKHKSLSSNLERVVTPSGSGEYSLARTQSSKCYTSATWSVKTSTGKLVHRMLSGESKKVTKGPRSPGSILGSSPRISNTGNVLVDHHRSLSLDMDFKSNGHAALETSGSPAGPRHRGSPHCQDNSAMARRRWV